MTISTTTRYEGTGDARNNVLRRAVTSCAAGQVFEVFDFGIYGFMAASIAKAFFPSSDPLAALLGTFAAFAIGFVVRPFGAVVIGAYGDRRGRREALVVTIGMMAFSTGAIGLIPSYQTIGIAAPILLVICRIFQGFSAGGEWGGAAAFLVEYAPDNRRGFISSFQQAGTALGLLLATVTAASVSFFLDAEALQSWGWRIPFLLGFVLGPIGHYLRTHVAETPAFSKTASGSKLTRSPFTEALATQKGPMIAAFGFSILPCVLYWEFFVFLPTYAAQQLSLSTSSTFFASTFSVVLYLVLAPAVGALSDRIGRKPLVVLSATLAIIFAYPLFSLLFSMKTITGFVLTQVIATLIFLLVTGVICAVLSEMFPTRIRYTALSVSYGFAVAIFGGFAPLVSTYLVQATGDPLAPSFYVIFAGVVSLISSFFIREGARKPLPE
ncbi:MFS transporter [Mesorhizobium sp. NZP2234]|uniref:MFS transporter n=1 Tax=Mesorhizobium sp. NZP2234 TaxID=2483402 RepID=UPI0015549AA8|nr:MFS transporter [Mesorhizobium sp. NZP2234]QKC91915.1 MFS transporter [Mesorhizobium sp. NZP2234]